MKFNHLILTLGLLVAAVVSQGAENTFQVKQTHEHHAKGLKRDKAKHKAFLASLPKHELKSDVAIPAVTDLTSQVSPPENQGSCGSCWDFSITKAARSAWMLVGKDPGTLAFNYLLNNCGPGPSEGGCGGGDFPAMANFLGGHGAWLESQDPYTGSEGSCKSGLAVAATELAAVQVGEDSPSFQLLASALSQNHMLSVDVAVCGSWENYSGGIFNENSCGESSIDHMINIVGYNCETSKDASGNCTFNAQGEPSNGDGYLIAMNNWGTSWGENGYMRSRAHMDALASTAMYFTVNYTPVPPIPPTPPVPPSKGPWAWWVWFLIGGVFFVASVGGIEIWIEKKTK